YKYSSPYKNMVFYKLNDLNYIYRKSGIDSWERIQMKGAPTNPLRVGDIYIVKPKAYAIPYVGSEVTLVGSWAAQRSAGADLYVGGVEAFSLTQNDTASTTFTPVSSGATVGVVLRFSNNTGLCKVTINGGTELINRLPKDVNGDVIIDTYS